MFLSTVQDRFLPVALRNIIAGLIIEGSIIVRKQTVDPGGKDLLDGFYDVVLIGHILDEPCIDLSHRPHIGDCISCLGKIVKIPALQ